MNEFIVWDKAFKIFRNKLPFNYCIDLDGKIKIFENKTIVRNAEDMYLFNYIGIKDINNEKIYADCSIVEFKYINKKLQGYFKFDKFKLKYFIILLNNKTLEYDPYNILNIKVIGTLQENKPELIK